MLELCNNNIITFDTEFILFLTILFCHFPVCIVLNLSKLHYKTIIAY